MEPIPQTPSVIARLMGLDELPPRQPMHKKHRVLSEEYLRKTASIGSRGNRSLQVVESSKIKTEKQHYFRDAIEVSDVSMTDKYLIHSVPKGKLTSSNTEVKKAFIRQKFTDAKHLSMDDRFLRLKEFNKAVEDLESNKGALLRLFQQPDCLFTDDLHDVQGVPYFHSDHPSVNLHNYSNNDNKIYERLKNKPARESVLRSLQKYENGSVADSCRELHKLSRSRMEWEDENFVSPRIIVLKPNFGKKKDAARSLYFSNYFLSSQLGSKNYMDIARQHKELAERAKLANPVEPSRKSVEALKGTPKDSVQQISNSTKRRSLGVSKSEFGVDDAFEKELMMPFYQKFVDSKNQSQTSFSSSNRSYLAREAKKQLFERWKMTRKFDEVGADRRSSTLGEMLAMPDHEIRPSNLSQKANENVLCSQFRLNERNEDLSSPLAIRSVDGCKDELPENVTKSRHFSVSYVANGNPKSRTKIEASHEGWCFGCEEAVAEETNKLRKQNCFEKDGSKPSSLPYGFPQSYPSMNLENTIEMQETKLTQYELERKLEKKVAGQGSSLVSNSLSCSFPWPASYCNHPGQGSQLIQDDFENSFKEDDMFKGSTEASALSKSSLDTTSMFADVTARVKRESMKTSKISEGQESGPRTYISLVKNGQSSSYPFDASTKEESFIGYSEEGLVLSEPAEIGPVFPVTLEETYQPSQNLVRQPPLQENLSGFQCSVITSDHLHCLGMHFKLLESELEDACSEGSGMAVSSDEDTGEGSFDLPEGNKLLMGLFRAEESRDFSYLVDVLDEAGFHVGHLDLGFETWHASECPLSLMLFDALEKKYVEQTFWKKSERRNLFDRINAALTEIVKPYTDIYLPGRSFERRFSATLKRDVAEEEVWMLLKSQEKEVNKDLSEKALGIELRWLELGEEISTICKEIEEFLFCELVGEF